MAANQDFLKVVRKNVKFLWPRVDQTYRYNNADKKTEACSPNVTGAGYSIAWEMPIAEGKALKAELKAHYEDCRKRNAKLPEFSDVFGSKRVTDADGKPTDFVQFTAKKRAISNDGKTNKPPVVVGPDLKDLEDKAIWTGSIGHIRALAFPTTDPDGKGGISLLLDAVQINEPVYGGDNLEDDFGPAQDFDSAIEETAERAAKEPALADDEF